MHRPHFTKESESQASRVGTLRPLRFQRQGLVPGRDDAGSSSAGGPGATTATMAAALTATLGLAAASWVIAIREMNGMDMGIATTLGSFAFFVPLWVPMMAAMMLPSTYAADVRRHTRRVVAAVVVKKEENNDH
jgi:hypothetical protein